MRDTDVLADEEVTLVEGRGRPVEVEDTPLVSDAERFQSVGLLGKGGMGEVRLTRDRRIARFSAVKVLHKAVEKDKNYRARFLLEARIQGQLEHPSIVPVHDLGETADGELYFSMMTVRGVTLRQAMDSLKHAANPLYTRRRFLTAFATVCQAVDFAHSRGVVHRDLKPQNVMLGTHGEVYVLDWGIAKVMHKTDTPLSEIVEAPASNTRAGAVLGTPKYMAPERQRNVASPQTDVFALGMILGEIIEAHTDQSVDPELRAIQQRAIAANPRERYPSARALHDDLEQYLDGRRDLEMRKKTADEHARRAAQMLEKHEPDARSLAGQEIGRALGLDPENRVALRTLMKMLTDVPAQLPPAAQVEMDKRWQERMTRTQRASTGSSLMLLLLVPMILAMGVRDWLLFGAFIAIVVAAGVVQYFGANVRWTFAAALTLLLAAISILTRSLGLLGVVPAAVAIVALAWRVTVEKTIHGIMIWLVAAVLLGAPFVLAGLGVIESNLEFRDGAVVLVPMMHDFPPGPTLAALLIGTFGAIGVAVIYGRLYVKELQRAEHRVSFQAWQLQQLVPPER
jgi:serine/threonine-protein kinase